MSDQLFTRIIDTCPFPQELTSTEIDTIKESLSELAQVLDSSSLDLLSDECLTTLTLTFSQLVVSADRFIGAIIESSLRDEGLLAKLVGRMATEEDTQVH